MIQQMGDISNFYCDRALEKATSPIYIANTIDFRYWTTRGGTKLKVSDMSKQHIKNIINMLRRTGDYYGWIPKLEKALEGTK